MRIGVLTTNLPSGSTGGAELQAAQVAAFLSRNHEVTVFTRSSPSLSDHAERPPGDFEIVKKAAQDLRRELEDMGLVTFCMLSGGKGVHIILPLTPGHTWDEHSGFAHRFALAMGEAEPERFVATMSKAKRKGRIFIDWLRNQRGSTSVAPFSARARAGAPVAVPILWEELNAMKDAHPYSIRDVSKLLKRMDEKLHGWGMAEQPLPRL